MRHLRRRGFTLIELLIVIGMIVLLATILLPMVNQARKQATRAFMAADLQVISQALDAYKHDFGDYPRPDRNQNQTNPNLPFVTGAALLCWALVAPGPAHPLQIGPSLSPGDGADGPGFRIRGTTGAIKGPYLPADRFLIGTCDIEGVVHPPNAGVGLDDAEDVLADRNSYPILYFAATPGALANSSPNGFVKAMYVPPPPAGDPPTAGSNPAVFIFDDNAIYLAPPSHAGGTTAYNPADLTRGTKGNPLGGWQVMSYRLGDTANPDGVINPATGENAITTGPYLLWSAGPDGAFGDDDDVMSDGSQLQPTQGPLPFNIQPH